MFKTAKTILLCVALAGFCVISAKAETASEYEVKAAFLYNFIKFVDWPPTAFSDTNSPVVIGILGADPFLDATASDNYLDRAIAGKNVNGRKVVIQRSIRVANLKNCHLLFINKSERGRLKDILANLKGLNILTVSETDNFCQQGGMINFVMQSGKVRFEINVASAENAGLKISSKLLSLAKIVPTAAR